MRCMARIGVAGAALAASVGLAACGGVDSAEVEELFSTQVEQVIDASGLDATIESVDCPDDISSDVGTTFECTAQISDGSTVSNTGEVVESSGDEVNVEFPAETLEGMPAPGE